MTLDTTEMFPDIANKSVRSTLQHQIDFPIEKCIKIFIDDTYINPKKQKDVEDVIRAYWSLQDFSENPYRINSMQQRIENIFNQHPGLIKKLQYCSSMFSEQQLKYTKAVQAIIKIGNKFPLFNTEYASDLHHPFIGESTAWGQTSGMADKQICILIASQDAKWIKSILAPDDVAYLNYIQKMFSNFNTATDFQIATSKMMMPIEKTPTFRSSAYSARLTSGSGGGREASKGDSSGAYEKYDAIFGNPFSERDMIARPGAVKNEPFYNPYRSRKNNNQEQKPSMDDEIHTGIVSKYGIIETYAFDIEKYKETMDPYVFNPRMREDNQQLYELMTSRFNMPYQMLLRALVSRAIISTHQYMVDFLISAHERKFSIPQLMMYYSPGTMIKVDTKYQVNQCSMVLGSYVDSPNGLALMLNVLNPNTTKENNIMIHDVTNRGLTKAKPSYAINIISAGARSGTVFNYYTPDASVSLMIDEDIPKQLEQSRLCLKMATAPKHMEIDSNYYYSDSDWGVDPEIKQEAYCGRVIVDYIKSRSGFTDFTVDAIKSKHTFEDVYELATIDKFKDNITYPGGIEGSGSNNTIILTGDKFMSDIRLLLSLPVAASAYILEAKRWGIVKLTDLKQVIYHPEAYDQLVMNDDIKESIRIVTKNQSKNTFKDIIGGKESGCIYLLTGLPGCGKSLCAESISEKLGKPLYRVSAGELGAEDWSIEHKLKNIFEQATRWNAIVLMDEADTFLYKRSDGNIERNAMVATFLRQLEYFNGTLFLTSNRADDIDEAFKSRILQIIQFESLDESERIAVWNNLLKRQGVSLVDKQLKELAKYNINGRLIKNIIKVSIAISIEKQKDLSFDILKTTAENMHGGAILTNKGFKNI